MRLYQCWFAFTHRSPIKNFASCRLHEKNFASLRLRKNLVELFARLSLLVDKTVFQYSALTICYTTISGHTPSARTPRVEGDAMDAAPDHTSTAPPGNGDALDLPDHTSTRTPRGMGRHGRRPATRTAPAPPWMVQALAEDNAGRD